MVLYARDVHAHFRSVGTWVDWEGGTTCDGFKAGTPNTPVTGIAVGWQSSLPALRQASDLGCNLFITHEPTFYAHMDNDKGWRDTEPGQRKAAFLDRKGMVVYRCHDLWDIFPRLGIVDAWSEFLDLGQPVATARYYNVHEVPTTTAWELTHRIALAVFKLHEQAVQLFGAKWQMVHRLAVGTGAITNVRKMVELGADVLLTTDDGATLWRDAAWLEDLGLPMILVNHRTAEIPGLYKLVEYLQQQFPGLPVHFVGSTCSYEIYATQRMREIQLRLRIDDLQHLPPVVLPEGYECRPMRPDQVWAYLEVMNRSNYHGEADQPWFEDQFARDPEYDPVNLLLIWKDERPVAATAAWQGMVDGERWGIIHWVGAVDSERGKGLGKAIVLAAMHRLRERGFQKAYLGTQDWRMPAINTYWSLGFRPWYTERVPKEVWDQILANLDDWRKYGRPALYEEDKPAVSAVG
jgi:putative NIF3 family GTP cyclohydrolase 1 type 2/GNAT superfamily N-acetyltransferase